MSFNPITDLRPPDPFNVPDGQSTEAIEAIRTRLVSTRNKTEELVQVIKSKNISFKKDIDKIQELNRRLRKTIPRIPIMRGDADATIGITVEEQFRKRFGLNLGGFARLGQKAPVKPGFPLLDVIVAAILAKAGIKKKVKIGGANTIKDFIRKTNKPVKIPEIFIPSPSATKRGKGMFDITAYADFLNDLEKVGQKKIKGTKVFSKPVKVERPSQEIPVTVEADPALTFFDRVDKLIKAKRAKKISRKEGFFSFSKKADKILADTIVPNNLKPNSTRLEVNRYVSQAQRAFSGKTKLKYPEGIDKDVLRLQNRADLKTMLGQREAKLEKLTPGTQEYKDMETSIRLVNNGLIRLEKSYQKYLQRIKEEYERYKRTQTLYNKESDMRTIEESLRQEFIDSQYFDTLDEAGKKQFIQRRMEMKKLLDRILSNEGAFLNTKPMNNDLAMLNTDTGITNTTVIITDQNNFLS